MLVAELSSSARAAKGPQLLSHLPSTKYDIIIIISYYYFTLLTLYVRDTNAERLRILLKS